MLYSSYLISAGVIGSDYAPASSVAYSSTPVVEKTYNTPTGYTKIIKSPPEYQSILTSKENNYESPDGTQHTAYTKSLDTAYSSLKKYEAQSTKDGNVIANTIPGYYSTAAYSPIVYHQETPYTVSSPLLHTVNTAALTKSVSVPITYTTHNVPLTKTIVSPSFTSYSTPILDKTKYVTSGLSSYSSHTPVIESQPIRTTITYSDAPIVSHVTFSGLGANYAW